MSANRNDRGSISTFYSLCLLLLCCSATCTKGETVLSIRDQYGSEVAVFDDQGNLYLNGGLTTNTTPQSTEYEEFRVQGYGQDVAIISMSTGDMTISGSLNENQTNMTGANNFVVKDNSSNPVAYIDTSGNLFLKGTNMGDIDVDSNRSGAIEGTSAEDDLEETQRAIVPVNCDNDDYDEYPDDKDCLNNCIDDESDLDDLIPLIIRKVPSGWTATLSIEDGDASKIRVFNGDDFWQEGDDYWYSGDPVPADHSWPILGRQEVSEQESTSVSSYQIPNLSNELTYYMEALEFRNSASDNWTIKLTVTNGSQTLYDRVKLRPSPFILLPGGSETVYAPDRSDSDQDDEIASVGSVIVSMNLGTTYAGDPWLQDAAEIGYTKWPGGQMNVVMDLPRSGPGRKLEYWPNTLLFSNIGVFTIGSGSSRFDFGGNIEATGEDYVVVGTGISGEITNFIEAQGIQSVITAPQTEYLDVGHIDELVSFSGSTSAYIADVNLGTLVIEKFVNTDTQAEGDVNNATEEYFEVLSGGWDDNQWVGAYVEIHDVPASTWQIRYVISNTENRINVYDATNEIGVPLESPYPDPNEWEYYLTARSEYSAVFCEGEEISGVVTGVQESGKIALDTSGLHDFTEVDWITDGYAIICYYNTEGVHQEYFKKITATTSTSFTLENSNDVSEGVYYVLVQKSKKDNAFLHVYVGQSEGNAACLTVKKFWETYSAAQAPWESRLEALETLLSQQAGISSFTSVPVLFDTTGTPHKAKAALPNMVNMSSTGAVPNPFGPRNANSEDQFIIDSPFSSGSCIDCWPLHVGDGEIHCGTNAIPAIPSTNWWE